jgi:hypothetical protein
MSAAIDPDKLTRQTRREEFLDGLNELQSGLIFLLLGALGAFLFSTAGMTFFIEALVRSRELTLLGLAATLALFTLIAFAARHRVLLRAGPAWGPGTGRALAGSDSFASDTGGDDRRRDTDHLRTGSVSEARS